VDCLPMGEAEMKLNNISISEIFNGCQGEIDVGLPAVFVRFSGCNLIQSGKACKFCDSLYAEQGTNYDILKLISKISKYDCNNIIITGGESLQQLTGLEQLVDFFNDKEYNIDIETNGTLFDKFTFDRLSHINCSPKQQALNLDILKKINQYPNSRFKFVYESKENKWWENVIKEVNIPHNKVYIMPEGKTREEQLQKSSSVVEYCLENNFNFSPRMHILIYDNKRGV
jgi:7-carboxy-7-deazaguanine synthase